MPRKNPPEVAVIDVDKLVAPPPPSPIVQALRKDWRWAGISQFLFTFSDAFGLVDWDIDALEADFDGDENTVIPNIIVKHLFALTYDRKVSRENVFQRLRDQYAKRLPRRNPLGTAEAPVEWAQLGLGAKVGILWQLCEWQMEDPARFRGLLKSEEEAGSWRIDPVGWDKEGNTYFLFDDNRLWVQRARPRPPTPPRPPKKSSQKAKKSSGKRKGRVSEAGSEGRSHKKCTYADARDEAEDDSLTPPPPEPVIKADEPVSGPRSRKQVSFYGNPTSTVQALKRGGPSQASTPASGSKITRSSSRGSLLVQQELPTPTRPSGRSNRSAGPVAPPAETASPSKTTPVPRGTRVSRRLRDVGDEWQQIPPEWLKTEGVAATSAAKANNKLSNKGKGKATADDESDLSDLTDEEEHAAMLSKAGIAIDQPAPAVGRGKRRKTTRGQVRGQRDEESAPVATEPEVEAAIAPDADSANDSAAVIVEALEPKQTPGGSADEATSAVEEAVAASPIPQGVNGDVAINEADPDELSGATTAVDAEDEARPTKAGEVEAALTADVNGVDSAEAAKETAVVVSAVAAAAIELDNAGAQSAKAAAVAEAAPAPVELVASASDADEQMDGNDDSAPAVSTEEPQTTDLPNGTERPASVTAEAEPQPLPQAESSKEGEVQVNGAPKEELSIAEDIKEEVRTDVKEEIKEEEEEYDEDDEVQMALKEDRNPPEGFVEWEAVCVTLYDWRTFPEQFAKSRDADEKLLYSFLTVDAGPQVIEALVAKEQERIKQEAINNRKRSSRIATKELEKEEIERRAAAQREMEARMDKVRSDEKRAKREAEEARAKEEARESRLREREERLNARERAIIDKAEEELREKERKDRARERRQRKREGEVVSGSENESTRAGTGTPAVAPESSNARVTAPVSISGSAPASSKRKPRKSKDKGKAKDQEEEGWELNCEVCRRTGWNLDDDADVVCCDSCNRWQHVECHNRLDASQGKRQRDWERVDFKCKECRAKAARSRERAEQMQAQGMANARAVLNGHTAVPPAAGFTHNPSPEQVQRSPAQGHGQAPSSSERRMSMQQQQDQSRQPPQSHVPLPLQPPRSAQAQAQAQYHPTQQPPYPHPAQNGHGLQGRTVYQHNAQYPSQPPGSSGDRRTSQSHTPNQGHYGYQQSPPTQMHGQSPYAASTHAMHPQQTPLGSAAGMTPRPPTPGSAYTQAQQSPHSNGHGQIHPGYQGTPTRQPQPYPPQSGPQHFSPQPYPPQQPQQQQYPPQHHQQYAQQHPSYQQGQDPRYAQNGASMPQYQHSQPQSAQSHPQAQYHQQPQPQPQQYAAYQQQQQPYPGQSPQHQYKHPTGPPGQR